MKNNFDKYLLEIWQIKDLVFDEYEKSTYENFSEYLGEQIKDLKLNYREKSTGVQKDPEIKDKKKSITL